MKIKYQGTRPCVSLCASGRTTYYFGPENGFVIDVENSQHASQILSSRQHKFVVVTEEFIPETPVIVEPIVKKEPVVKKELKKKEKKHGKK